MAHFIHVPSLEKMKPLFRPTKLGRFLEKVGVLRRKFVLLEELKVDIGLDYEYTVPVGFVTDYASVPIGFRWILPVYSKKVGPCAIVHDLMCRQARDPKHWMTRQFADAVFYSLLRVKGVSRWRRGAAHLGVSLFGAYLWITDKVK